MVSILVMVRFEKVERRDYGQSQLERAKKVNGFIFDFFSGGKLNLLKNNSLEFVVILPSLSDTVTI